MTSFFPYLILPSHKANQQWDKDCHGHDASQYKDHMLRVHVQYDESGFVI
jgi:hypothetical protein